MVSYAEYHRAFHVYAKENSLSGTARALYGYLVGEFNAQYWKAEEISKSVREVRAESGIKSESMVQRAKAELGTEQIIKLRKRKGVDVYRLTDPCEWLRAKGTEYERNGIGTAEEQARNGNGTGYERTEYARAEDVKDRKDGKDKEDFATTTAAGVRVHEVSDAVKETWQECRGERLRGGAALGMLELEGRYGTEAVVKAIIAADQYNSRDNLSFNLVKRVLERKDERRGKVIELPRVEGGGWGKLRRAPGEYGGGRGGG